MSSHFEIHDLSVSLNGRRILDHITCSVDEPGHVIALLGPNGSGKTTLLRSVCGELPHSGNIFLDGTDLFGLFAKPKQLAKLVSYVPQQSGISISMSVMDVVLMGFYSRLKLLSQPTAAMQDAARLALARVGISHLSDRDYMTLSGGEKQLVILARTLVEDTKLLLFDEPDSSLDLTNKYRMLKLIAEILHGGHDDMADRAGQTTETSAASKQRSALLCLHDPVLALTYCDILFLLKDGRLIGTLRPQTDSIADMEQAFRELYGNVRLIQVPDPEDPSKTRLVLLPVL